MSIIKLDAIDSTNDYLKQLSRGRELDDFTVVIAFEQKKGRGQLNAKWSSEPGKNLTMSIFVNENSTVGLTIFDFNVTVALAVVQVLKQLNISNTNLKWPNDIMSDGKKVGGILIENSFKPNGSFASIVGVGLNLNQTNFEDLPQATSLTCVTGIVYDVEVIAGMIKNSLQLQLQTKIEKNWETYLKILFKRNRPCAFEDFRGERFMGIIQSVDRLGKLVVLKGDEHIYHYEVKEIKMLY